MNLLPKTSEIKEQSILINESFKHFGFKAEVLIPKSIDLPDVGYQQEVTYDDADKFYAWLSIDPHPKPKLLQTLGWIIEETEVRPLLCYISRYLQTDEDTPRDVNTTAHEVLPIKYTRLTLEHDYLQEGKEFIVTKVSSNSFNPYYYIILIVPYRPTRERSPDPLRDNNMDMVGIEQTDSNFNFLNADRFDEVDIKY